MVLQINSVVCQYLPIYKMFDLLVENSLASKPNVSELFRHVPVATAGTSRLCRGS